MYKQVVTGIFSLVGVVIGWFLSMLTNRAIEKWRNRRMEKRVEKWKKILRL